MSKIRTTSSWITLSAHLFICAVAASSMSLLYAQNADYPNRPIKVIVPFPPGGGGDTLARLVLTRAAKELGQPMVFENQPGANGNLGSAKAARAEPDGYTILYGTNGSFAINRTLYKRTGFDVLKDLQPLTRMTQMGLLIAVKPNSPVADLKDLISRMKASPGKYTFSSGGSGTSAHLANEMLKSQAGYSSVHIPYRGGAGALMAAASGEVDMIIEVLPSTVPLVKGGLLRPLAITLPKRSALLPDVPTVAESGWPSYSATAWDGVMVPVGTPSSVIDRLNVAIRKALADPELQKQLGDRGAEGAPTTPQEFGNFIRLEIDRWGAAVRRSGAVVD